MAATSLKERNVGGEDATYYDEDVATTYAELPAQAPWWEHCETYTTKLLLGDIKGLSVLDLGCGEGRSVRNMLSWGAAKGVGVDISEHMVNIARSKHTANTEFHVMCSTESKLPETLQQKFDLVTSFWVMQYMSNYSELRSHIQAAYNSLKNGGSFCSIVSAYSDKFPLKGENRLMTVRFERQSIEEFSPLDSYLGLTDNSPGVLLSIYSLYPQTIESVLKEVGFSEIETMPMGLSKEGEEFYTKEAVDESFSHVFIFRAKK